LEAFAVAGAPVLHSASPRLFAAAFARAGRNAIYTRLAAKSACDIVRLARGIGLRGFNVTAPFKEEMALLCDSLDDAAAGIGAVNTVLADEDGLRGFNTDADGVMAALRNAGIEAAGARAVILGAGGAAKAAAFGLRAAGAMDVAILARDEGKARLSAAQTGCSAGSLAEAARWTERADVLVSCLPPQASPLAANCLRPGLAVLDANYHAPALVLAARARGCAVARGGDWLVGQAESAFRIFTGAEAPAGAMAEALCDPRAREESKAKARVALTGFSGSGKSAVAPLLATLLKKAARDTDAMAEAKACASTGEIFEKRGEMEFRRLEKEAVLAALGEEAIVALGGGALLDPESFERVVSECLVVWLWADPATAENRAMDGSRPLFRRGADVAALLDARMPGYLRAAQLVIAADRDGPGAIAERIADEIRLAFGG